MEARKQTHLEATLVYDLYTIALSSREQYAALARVSRLMILVLNNDLALFFIHFQFYDRAMKFSFENVHVWIQFALSLISAGRVSYDFFVL